MATRRRSRTFTTQGEIDCAYHVCSKLMIKNMVEFVMPLPVSEDYDAENCNQFLNTRMVQLEGLTREKCTPNGYLKIILFHYFYTLYYLFMLPTYLSFTTAHVDAIANDLILPTIPPSIHKNDIRYVMRHVNHVKDRLGIEWRKVAVFEKEQMFSFIKKVTDLDFYVALNLKDDEKVGGHVNHSVVVVGTYDDKLLIKNSWGDEELYEMKINEKLALEDYRFGVTSCVFYLPCRSVPIDSIHNLETRTQFSAWLDNYIMEFPEMVAPIPAILASTPDPPDYPVPEVEPSKRMRPTFKVGDMVISPSYHTPVKIIEMNGPKYRVSYQDEWGDERQMDVERHDLTKVGGKSRRRTRKRIR